MIMGKESTHDEVNGVLRFNDHHFRVMVGRGNIKFNLEKLNLNPSWEVIFTRHWYTSHSFKLSINLHDLLLYVLEIPVKDTVYDTVHTARLGALTSSC